MKILFVTEVLSSHGAAWVNQFDGLNWKIHIFQGFPSFSQINENYKQGDFYLPFKFGTEPKLPVKYFLESEAIFINPNHSFYLQREVRKKYVDFFMETFTWIKPDIVHLLGLNINWHNMSELLVQAKQKMGKKFQAPIIYSSWGTDLDYYAKLSVYNYHKVEEFLKICDFYIAECKRDRELAVQMGFKGKFLGYFPAVGGLSPERLFLPKNPSLCSKRSLILIKGRDLDGGKGDPVGRAKAILDAIFLVREKIKEVPIFIFQPSGNIVEYANKLKQQFKLKIQPLSFIEKKELMSYFAQARLFVSMDINSGLPISLMEALVAGAFPICSNISSLREFIHDGQNGYLASYENADDIGNKIIKAMDDQYLVDRAQAVNRSRFDKEWSYEKNRESMIKIYKDIIYENK